MTDLEKMQQAVLRTAERLGRQDCGCVDVHVALKVLAEEIAEGERKLERDERWTK